MSLSEFMQTHLGSSKGVHTPKNTRNCCIRLRKILCKTGDVSLHRIDVREIENFLAAKKREASERITEMTDGGKRWK
jgi:hypothetical protein